MRLNGSWRQGRRDKRGGKNRNNNGIEKSMNGCEGKRGKEKLGGKGKG